MNDLISRDAVIAKLRELTNPYTVIAATSILEEIPSVNAAPVVHGRWMKKHDKVCYWRECSVCGAKPLKSKYGAEAETAYCPDCGSKMDLVADDE